MTPTWIGRFGSHEFAEPPTACQGPQVAMLVRAVAEVAPGLTWYASDVLAPGVPFWSQFRGATPGLVGLAADVAREAEVVPQFESGVLVGVPDRVTQPRFRDGGVWTEDEEGADLGNGVVEIRAFDTKYILVTTTLSKVRAHLGG